MNKIVQNALCALLVVYGMSGYASAQTVLPNYGNYQGLDANYRIGIQLSDALLALPTLSASFQQSTISDITRYVDPAEIAAYVNLPGAPPIVSTIYAQQGQVNGVFDVRGVPVLAGYNLLSPVLTVRFIDLRSAPALDPAGTLQFATLTDASGQPCSFTYNGTNRTQSFAQFDTDTSDGNTPVARRMFQCLARGWASSSPVDPLAGNPYSLQSTLVRSALDLTQGDSLVEMTARAGPNTGANSAGDPWAIGASYSGGTADRFHLMRIDGRVTKGWRVFAGSRARLRLDLPFNYTRIKGASAYTGQIGLALEYPIKRNWSIEPRISYGLTYSGDQGSVGHIAQGAVTSRYVIGGLGRGALTIGNMVGYSTTLKTPGDIDLNPHINNWVFRNGLAYELPLKMRVAARATSVRASYAFTTYSGAKLYNNNFHEATVSFGLRGREDTPRQFRDVVRVIFSTIQARGFRTYTGGVGFQF